MNDIDINAADARTHRTKIVLTICRYSLAAIVSIVATCAWRCDSPGASTAEKDRAEALGALSECRRWTQ